MFVADEIRQKYKRHKTKDKTKNTVSVKLLWHAVN